MEANLLLESYLKQLHLPGFLRSYRSFATDAAHNNEDHVRYLLALAEQEVRQREQNIQRERIKQARFPALKELADFDFSAVPTLNKAYVLDLTRGDYIARHEPVILHRQSGLRQNPFGPWVGAGCLPSAPPCPLLDGCRAD